MVLHEVFYSSFAEALSLLSKIPLGNASHPLTNKVPLFDVESSNYRSTNGMLFQRKPYEFFIGI